MEKEYLKRAAWLLDRDFLNRRGLDLSEEVLWVSLGQRAAELPSIKVKGLKKNSATRRGQVRFELGRAAKFFLKPPTSIAGSFAALWPKETHSTSLERSIPLLLT